MNSSNNETPLVSIGIPVYNGGAFLSHTLDSILCQTYKSIEVVIRDNNSTDDTCQIVADYMERDQRIKFSRASQNQGAARNFNAVFEQARGPYFKWAAADDLLAPTFVEKCVAVLEDLPACVLAYPQTDVIDAAGQTLESLDDELEANSDDPVIRYRLLRSALKECNAVFGVIRTDVLIRTNLIRPYMAADMHLLAELALYGQLIEIPDRLFFRRDHEEASSVDKTEAAQAIFYDPEHVGRPLMSCWNGLFYDCMPSAPMGQI